jgi:hypothetical protein
MGGDVINCVHLVPEKVLHDLTQLQLQEEAIGGVKREQWDKAWGRAHELFEP